MALFSRSLLSVLAFAALMKTGSGAEHTVAFKDTPVWTAGVGVSYADMTIDLGHTLSFTSVSSHDVSLLIPTEGEADWALCPMTGGPPAESKAVIFASSDFAATHSEKHYTPPTCGVYYLACSVLGHCFSGQRVKVTVNNVDASACAMPCVGAECVTDDSKKDVTETAMVHGVKPALPLHYWGAGFYDDMSINIGDTVVFKTAAGWHDISTVPDAAAYDSCTTTNKVVHAAWAYDMTMQKKDISSTCEASADCCTATSCGEEGMYATYTYTATTAGDVHFICAMSDGMHCKQGQKFKLTVKPDPTTTTPMATTKMEEADGANLVMVSSSAALLAVFAHLV